MPPSFLGDEVGGNEGEITRNVRRSDGRDYSRRMGGLGRIWRVHACFESASSAPFIFVTWVVGRRKRIEGEGRQVSLRLTMFPLRNFDLGTETERARLTSETGRAADCTR